MASLFLLEDLTSASKEIAVTLDCYFQGDESKRLGFGTNHNFWAEYVQELWIYDRKLQTILSPSKDRTEMVRRIRSNMRSYAIGFIEPNQYLQNEFRLLANAKNLEKENLLRKKYKLKPANSNEPSIYNFLGQNELDVFYLKAQADNFAESQIWKFNDRGEYCTVLARDKDIFLLRLTNLLEQHHVDLIFCSRIEEVPVW